MGGGPPPMGGGGMGGPPPNSFPHDGHGGPPMGMMRSRSQSLSPPTRGRHHKRRRSPSRSACAPASFTHQSVCIVHAQVYTACVRVGGRTAPYFARYEALQSFTYITARIASRCKPSVALSQPYCCTCRSDIAADGKRSSKRSGKRQSRKQRYSSTPSGSSYTGSSTGSETDRSRSPVRRKKAAAPAAVAPAAKGANCPLPCL